MTIRRVLATIALATVAGVAQAADAPGRVVVHGSLSVDTACQNSGVLGRIMERFAWAERHTWQRGFVMASLYNARLSGHPFFEPGLIERTYCMADSVMTNGETRTVYYAIEFGQGFASLGNYVDFCVLGLDPWRVHDAGCRTVQ